MPLATTSSLAPVQPTARTFQAIESTGAFIDSVGVNMHSGMSTQDISYKYRDTALVESALKYIDVTHIRDTLGIGFSLPAYDYTTVTEKYLAERGYKFDFPISTLATYEKDALHNFATAYPGALASLEGPNEVNHLTVDQAKAYQKSLFDFVHGDALLKNTPVLDFTLTYSRTDYLLPYGDLSSITDQGNVHIYATYGHSPSAFDDWLAVTQAATPGLRMNVTETGYSTLPSNTAWGVDETTQAKYILNTLMDAAENHVGMTYLYELLDRDVPHATSPLQGFFGLFHSDGTPKPSAVAIHNLTTIFNADAKEASGLGKLDVVFNKPLDSRVHTTLIQKNGNTYDLVLWAEPNIWDPGNQKAIQAPTISVDLSFPGAKSATLFDPLLGTAPVQVFNDPRGASVIGVTDHPVIIEITLPDPAQSGTGTTSVANLAGLERDTHVTAITVSDTAANLAGALAALGADAKVKSITVVDANPLALSFAQWKSSTAGLGKMASYDLTLSDVSVANLAVEKAAHVTAVGVRDTAAKLSGTQLGILGADAKVASITANDGKPIALTYSQYAADGAALAKMTGGYTVTVSAATVSGLTALDADSHVTNVAVRDMAANLDGATFGLLGSDSKVQSIALADGKPIPLVLTYAQYQGDSAALAKLVGSYYLSVIETPVARLAALEQDTHVTAIGVSDTAANLAGALVALGIDAKVKSVTVADSSPLAMTYAQFKSSTAGLSKTASYSLTLSDVTIANLTIEKNVHVTAVAVSDTAAKLSGAEFGVLGADAKVTSIAASDGKPITLSYAQYAAGGSAMGKLNAGTGLSVTGVPVSGLSALEGDPRVTGIAISDTAAKVAAAFADLHAHSSLVTSIGFTDKTAPSITLTAAQAEADASLLPEITSAYALNILMGTDAAMSSAFDLYAEASSKLLYTEFFRPDGSHSYDVMGNGLKLTASHNDDFNLLTGANDTIAFGAKGFGNTAIAGFSAGDTVQFAKSIFADYATLSTHVSGTTDAVITDTAGDSVTLKGVAASSLTPAMFKFG